MKILKKSLSVLLAVVLTFTLIPVTAYAIDSDELLISSAQDLEDFRDRVNSGELNLNAKLTTDIVLNENFEQDKFSVSDDGTVTYNGGEVPTSFKQWIPIGDSYGKTYSGVFDGNGHTISGLYINNESQEQALFGCIGSTVKNLGITNSFVYSSSYAGGIVGTNYDGSVINCFNDGFIYSTNTAGGVVCYGMGTITDCYNSGEVTASNNRAGGIIGDNYGIVTNCYNTGTVNGGDYVGGIVGFNDAYVSNCYNLGEISGNEQVGGVVGYNMISMKNCYNAGVIAGNVDSGSVSGYNDSAEMENCYYLEGTAQENNPLAISKTKEQFESGEVAYLLQKAQDSSETVIWGQQIGTDEFPVINGAEVYENQRYQGCEGNSGKIISYYSNEEKTLEYGDHNYSEGGICKDCGHLENGRDGFKSASLTLTDGVIINYYVILTDEAKADQGAYIRFTSVNGIDKRINLSNGVKDGERYKFSLELRPDRMADKITAQIVYSDGITGNSVVYSVKEYADKVENTDTSKALVDAMLRYGAFSQLYTGENTDELVTDVSDYTQNAVVGESYKYNLSNNTQGITIKSATLQLGAAVTIRMKLHIEDGADISKFTFKCDDKILIPEKSGNEYYVYLKNIAPQDFDEMHSFTVSDGTNTSVLEYSVFSYMKNVLDNAESYNKKIVNLMNSMYDYNQQAEAYIV